MTQSTISTGTCARAGAEPTNTAASKAALAANFFNCSPPARLTEPQSLRAPTEGLRVEVGAIVGGQPFHLSTTWGGLSTLLFLHLGRKGRAAHIQVNPS